MRLIIAFVVLSLIQGCTQVSLPQMPTNGAAEMVFAQRVARLNAEPNWQAVGQMGIVSPQGGGTVSLRWQQADAAYTIRLIAPLGQGGASLRSDGQTVHLQTSTGIEDKGSDAQAMLEKRFGWPVPVDDLQAWIRGVPGSVSDFDIDRTGRLKVLRAEPWTVKYLEYKKNQTLGVEMPSLIVISSAAATLRVSIRSWTP